MPSNDNFGLSLQTTSGGGNQMANFLQSLTNKLSTQGEGTFGTGQSTFQQGVNDFQPSLNYWNEILSGNKAQMESAIAPEKNDILSQYRARRRSLAQTGSRGGGTNEATAQSEYSQAGDVAGLLQKLRPQAAKESAGIAGKIGELGLSESKLGMEQIFQALQGSLTQRGQNVSQQISNLGDLTAGLESAFTALV